MWLKLTKYVWATVSTTASILTYCSFACTMILVISHSRFSVQYSVYREGLWLGQIIHRCTMSSSNLCIAVSMSVFQMTVYGLYCILLRFYGSILTTSFMITLDQANSYENIAVVSFVWFGCIEMRNNTLRKYGTATSSVHLGGKKNCCYFEEISNIVFMKVVFQFIIHSNSSKWSCYNKPAFLIDILFDG